MKFALGKITNASLLILGLSIAMPARSAHAQSCQMSEELDNATRTAITTAGQRYFEMAAKGDGASLRQNSMPALAASIEATVKEGLSGLDGAQASIKSVFLLDASGSAPIPHAEFYCGVFGKNGQTANSAEFSLDNLPPAKYAVVLAEANSPKARTMFSEILQQVGSDWKLAGLYIKPAQAAGHDSDWFLARARDYKAKGQRHNAWLFYREALSLISPVQFMSTLATDKLYDESQGLQSSDLPGWGKTADLAAGTTTYKLTQVDLAAVNTDLDLIVKYQSADAADGNQAYQENMAVMKAFVAKYPEVREAFAAVVAHAVDAQGHDYGTLLAMKDIK
ncbi:MAG TPA: hypothetical protein VHV29_01170 [Terriglobales bacterium]|jgi:hypothetical protein|nr:hypothetical protein [Terriglobales bacterium]